VRLNYITLSGSNNCRGISDAVIKTF